MTVLTEAIELRGGTGVARAPTRWFTYFAVHQGDQWASLCRELGVASCGATADGALDRLEAAVKDLLAFHLAGGPDPGAPVSDDDLEAFLRSHEGPSPLSSRVVEVLDVV